MADLGGGEDRGDISPNRNEQEDCSLVLSIFKGENFVVKDSPGYKCKIVAEISKAKLETGVVDLLPGKTDPNFNAQLAWKFTRKEIQRLRSDREALTLEFFLVNNEQNIEDKIGYIVLASKDAFLMNFLHEVDPATAKVHSLLGTRDPWIKYHPKIHLHFHIEGPTSQVNPKAHKETQIKRKTNGTSVHFGKNSVKYPRSIIARNGPSIGAIHSLADPNKIALGKGSKLTPAEQPGAMFRDECPQKQSAIELGEKKDEFEFRVNEMGYFELGETSSSDDMYVVSVTVLHSNNLHLLERLPEQITNYKWSIEYKAFGYHISSDPFELDEKSEIRRGFVGDKATARIRASGAAFYDYLSKSSIGFHVFRTKPASTVAEELGRSFLGLAELTSPNTFEVKYDLEIVSVTPYPVSSNFLERKPELRVSIELEVIPGFFNNEWQITKSPMKAINEDKVADGDETEEGTEDEVVKHFENLKIRDENVPDQPVRSEIDGSSDQEQAEVLYKNKNWELTESAKYNEANKNYVERSRKKNGTCAIEPTTNKSNYGTIDQPIIVDNEVGDSEVMEPGIYKIQLCFESLYLKSKRPITEDFQLSFKHPPIGLHEKIECVVRPVENTLNQDPTLRCGAIEDGSLNMTVSLKTLSDDLLMKPIMVKISPLRPDGSAKERLAFSRVKFGHAFFTQKDDGKRRLKSRASVFQVKSEHKIGYLEYTAQVELVRQFQETQQPCDINKDEMVDGKNVGPSELAAESDLIDAKKKPCSSAAKTEEELEEWKRQEERIFKAQMIGKEKAYLRILSEEWKKKDAERENQISERIRLLQQREDEAAKQTEKLAKQEESLKTVESEIKLSAKTSTFESQRLLESQKLRYLCQLEAHKHEIGLLQRRIQEYVTESEKKKGKLLLLETRLKEKEDEVAKLLSTRNRWSDMEQSRELDKLTTENKYLKDKLKDTEKQCSEYQRRISKLYAEIEIMKKQSKLNLQAENEQLRVQLLASQQRNDMIKDRKSVKEVADQIKALYEFYEKNSKAGVESISTPDPKGSAHYKSPEYRSTDRSAGVGRNYSSGDAKEEKGEYVSRKEIEKRIKGLCNEKDKLMCQGTYSKYDVVIRDLDTQITKLAGKL